MSSEPFFLSQGEQFIPQPICRGPWGPETLHGRVVAGLLSHEIERKWLQPGFLPSRLTVDLYRMPKFAPCTVESRVVRDGNRIRIVDAEFFNDGVSVGRASCVMLRTSENPEGRVWGPEPALLPAPESVPPPDRPPLQDWEPMWDTRNVGGHAWGAVLQKQCWLRGTRELIGGVELTPFQRVALAADFASPFANAGENGLEFVNADITMYLHRLPATPWVGFEVLAHHAADGIAVGECMLYDEAGPIGHSIVCALAQKRRVA